MPTQVFATVIILLALAGVSVSASGGLAPGTRTAICYSFDTAPSGDLLAQMQTEFQRIVGPLGVPVAWREAGEPISEFADIFVVRFRGSCTMAGSGTNTGLGPDERSLAETQISDGHVLPFADVRCDSLRRYLKSSRDANPDDQVLARAMARVTAHEIFHMATGSVAHCGTGIARAEFSRADLTSATFRFGPKEADRLRSRLHRLP